MLRLEVHCFGRFLIQLAQHCGTRNQVTRRWIVVRFNFIFTKYGVQNPYPILVSELRYSISFTFCPFMDENGFMMKKILSHGWFSIGG